ncbi:hypothetical protein OUZ56_009558 [Daphnia magna]|uniref:Uncharacterized protein n=1 Tax=Daphnia magna TaxID=35525 RepID=A0ABR0AGD2_9CRUS|nr:hypothetical protein OUZ56_009558 [Daphnia magna]
MKKPNRPVNYLSWLKRLNCEPVAIPRTTYYRMRLNMGLVNRRTVVGQMRAQNEYIGRHLNTNYVDREYIIGGDVASNNIFHNDDHHQEQQLRIDSDDDDDHSSNTADHSPPEYASGSDEEGDVDRDAGDQVIGPSSKDLNTYFPRVA